MRGPRAVKAGILALAMVAGGLAACAPAPRPALLDRLASLQQGPAHGETARWAPQAAAHADQLAKEAEDAQASGDSGRSTLLAERAVAAYGRARVVARIAKARERLAKATARADATSLKLARIDGTQQRLEADLARLEKVIRVLRDALTPAPLEDAAPERAQARRDAARAMATEARLLCVAAHLLDPDTKVPSRLTKGLDALDERLADRSVAAPLAEVTRRRAECLSVLTAARRPTTKAHPASAMVDQLLAALAGDSRLFAFRDDRGVVVNVGDVAQGGELSKEARARLEALSKVAAEHPKFPVLLVIHGIPRKLGAPTAKESALLKAIAAPFEKQAKGRLDVVNAGDKLPLVEPGTASATKTNRRVEVVFVAPLS